MASSRFDETRPNLPRGPRVAEVLRALTEDTTALGHLEEVYRALFLAAGATPGEGHYVYVQPSRARSAIGQLATWLNRRFGAPAQRVPSRTPFGYLSDPYDGWITLFAAVLFVDEGGEDLRRDFAAYVGPLPWSGVSRAVQGFGGNPPLPESMVAAATQGEMVRRIISGEDRAADEQYQRLQREYDALGSMTQDKGQALKRMEDIRREWSRLRHVYGLQRDLAEVNARQELVSTYEQATRRLADELRSEISTRSKKYEPPVEVPAPPPPTPEESLSRQTRSQVEAEAAQRGEEARQDRGMVKTIKKAGLPVPRTAEQRMADALSRSIRASAPAPEERAPQATVRSEAPPPPPAPEPAAAPSKSERVAAERAAERRRAAAAEERRAEAAAAARRATIAATAESVDIKRIETAVAEAQKALIAANATVRGAKNQLDAARQGEQQAAKRRADAFDRAVERNDTEMVERLRVEESEAEARISLLETDFSSAAEAVEAARERVRDAEGALASVQAAARGGAAMPTPTKPGASRSGGTVAF